jgi:hypothetical protein
MRGSQNQARESAVGWGEERTPTSSAFTPIADGISLGCPIGRDHSIANKSMNTLMRPIGGTFDVSVFHGIVMNVIHMAREIIFVTNQMFPIATLPNTFDFLLSEIRSPLGKRRENPALISYQRVATSASSGGKVQMACR